MSKYSIPNNYTLFKEDLDLPLKSNLINWKLMDGKKILITGASGFFGKWLIETLLWAIEVLEIELNITILTRNKNTFCSNVPLTKNLVFEKKISFIETDLSKVDTSKFRNIDYIFHFATNSSPNKDLDWAREQFNSSISGIRNVLEIAKNNPSCSVLVSSSGAIYKQLDSIFNDGFEETFNGPSEYLSDSYLYQLSKKNIEAISAFYSKKYGIRVLICRCFAFTGAYLPLSSNFAIGNFIESAILGKDILINSDGKSIRSYMYMSDLIIWLVSILQRGDSSRPYNVGSPFKISIADLAFSVKELCNPNIKIVTTNINKENSIYYPSSDRVKRELNLDISVQLDEAILKTYNWYKNFYK